MADERWDPDGANEIHAEQPTSEDHRFDLTDIEAEAVCEERYGPCGWSNALGNSDGLDEAH